MANVLVRGVDRGGGVGWDGVVWWTGDVGHGSWFDPLRFNRYHRCHRLKVVHTPMYHTDFLLLSMKMRHEGCAENDPKMSKPR